MAKKTNKATKSVANIKSDSKAPMNLKEIALGKLVGEIRDVVVPFLHNGEMESVEIRIKQLPFAKTDSFQTRLNKQDTSVIGEWIAEALVDDDGKNYLTAEQVNDNFTQSLVSSVFEEVSGLKQLQKFVEELGKELATKTNSGQSSSSMELVDEA